MGDAPFPFASCLVVLSCAEGAKKLADTADLREVLEKELLGNGREAA